MSISTFIEVATSSIDEIYQTVMLASVGQHNATPQWIEAVKQHLYLDHHGGKLVDLLDNKPFMDALHTL